MHTLSRMPSSPERIAASQANGRLGRGPTSETGKQNSSRNATRHGLLTSAVLVDNESRDRFADLLNSFNSDFNPANNTERILVEKMAVSHWRLQRIWSVESAAINHESRLQTDPAANNDPPTSTMLAIRAMNDRDRHPIPLPRYEHAYDRGYYRALAALTKLQEARNTKTTKRTYQLEENNQPASENEPTRTPIEPKV